MDEAQLAREALAAREGSHSPYSGFRVGVALLCEDGSLIRAANLENASLGLSVCAERNAVAAAVSSGRRRWARLAIATDADGFIPPCGACLQVLREFVPAGEELEILLVNREGERERRRLGEFLPLPFTDYPRGGGME
jgi:cytidine deaminase